MRSSPTVVLHAVVALSLLACGERTDRPSPDDAGIDGGLSGGSGSDASTPDNGGSGAGSSGTTPMAPALDCDAANNPAFGSCLDTLIDASCWDPDIDGQCIDDGEALTWESGHRRSGSPFGDTFHEDGGGSCLELEYFATGASPDVQFLSSGADNVTIDETADGSMRIVCSDTTTVMLTPEQAFDYFRCKGLVCQCPIGSKFILPCITNDFFCEDTGGTWERCLHECGQELSCEVPGCDCGPGQTLVRGMGCQPDPSCD